MDKQKAAWFFGWLVTRKGSSTSGNWMHKGDPPNRGGSAPGGGHAAMGIAAGTPTEEVKEKIAQHREQRDKKTSQGGPVRPGMPGDMSKEADARAEALFTKDLDRPKEQYYTSSYERQLRGEKIDQRSGALPGTAYNMIDTWAMTSNDEDPDALLVQQVASETFGIPLSKWQKDEIELTKADFAPEPLETYYTNSREDIRKTLTTMYDDTQRYFRDAGFKPGDTVTLFRGTDEVAAIKPGDTVGLEQNTISSWSIDYNLAYEFGEKNSGCVLSMKVPIESVFSMGSIGLGTIREGEFVVFGVPGSQAKVVRVIEG